ncbi:MAG TPA: hypothetical protein PLS03_02750 [Terrimicrobiaceae bacterium]|nr:hypothetical protein [Terrimicrobiaceae bacterium]
MKPSLRRSFRCLRQLRCVTAALAILPAASWASEIVFEDDFESANDQGVSHPATGTFPVFRAKAIALSELGPDAASTTAQGSVLQLDRSEERVTGHVRVIGELTRTVQAGEKLRLSFDGRLERGTALQFGFGSIEGGIDMGKGHAFTIICAIADDGSISVYDGTSYRTIRELTAVVGKWDQYVLEFTPCSGDLVLAIGNQTATVPGPFAAGLDPVSSVHEIFFSTASNEVTGQIDNVKAEILAPGEN